MDIHKYTCKLWNKRLWASKSCLLDMMEEWAAGSGILLLFFIDKHIYFFFFAVPNWLCSAELHLWIIWHISCYFFDRSTQRKFQGTFLLTSRNINIWINCRFGSLHMDALQKDVYVCVRACVLVKGMGRGLFHSVTTVLSPWARRQKSVCSISLGKSSTEWHVKHTSPSTWWSLLLSDDKKPLCRLALFSTERREKEEGGRW